MLKKLFIALTVLIIAAFQTNNPPVVTIINPKPGDKINGETAVRYTIHVSDKEDGDTRFDEIPVNEILLEITAVNDTSATTATKTNLSGLHGMMKSNCMNCHAFDAKLIGPSFKEIANRYDKSSIHQLVSHVRDGSTGIWGDIPMPTHHELSDDQTKAMVEWILSRKHDSTTNYFLGTEGSFRLTPSANASYLRLTASYLDKGGQLGEHSMWVEWR